MKHKRTSTSVPVLFSSGNVAVGRHKVKGFCVFAAHDLKKGAEIAVTPVCPIGFNDIKESSPLYAYPMAWSSTQDVIAFGVANLLNHADDPNVRLVRDKKNWLIRVYAKRSIPKGTELTISYACALWFPVIPQEFRARIPSRT